MKFAYTILFTRDLSNSRSFYENFFNQVVDVDFDYLVGFSSGLALWRFEEGATSLGVPQVSPLLQNRGGSELEFHTEDIDADFQRLAAAGIPMLHAIITHPWQQRCFRCLDPDGHVIEVAEALAVTARRLVALGWKTQAIADCFKTTPVVVETMLDSQGHL